MPSIQVGKLFEFTNIHMHKASISKLSSLTRVHLFVVAHMTCFKHSWCLKILKSTVMCILSCDFIGGLNGFLQHPESWRDSPKGFHPVVVVVAVAARLPPPRLHKSRSRAAKLASQAAAAAAPVVPWNINRRQTVKPKVWPMKIDLNTYVIENLDTFIKSNTLSLRWSKTGVCLTKLTWQWRIWYSLCRW